MDIKLKNSRRLGIIIAILTIVCITAGVLACYPHIWNQLNHGSFIDSIDDYDWDNYWRLQTMVWWMLFGTAAVTVLTAFITGLIKPLGLTEWKVFYLPFELLAVIAIVVSPLMLEVGDLVTDIVLHTMTGELQDGLGQALYINQSLADVLIMGGNAVMWMLIVAFTYWLTISAASIFTLGIKRWFWERTLTGRFIRWGKKMIEVTCRQIGSVDFRDRPTKLILKIVGVNFLLLTIISSFWFYGIFGLLVYSIVLFFLLRRIYDDMQGKYQILLGAAGKMAEGNLDVEMKGELGVFEPLRGEMYKIRNGFKLAVEEEVKSRSMKTELITNVSHDLKTPLTAIITYVNLLKDENITPEQRTDYIEVLDRKSMRLKSLIEDLFEISKANSDNVTLNLVEVDIASLMKQVRLELDDKLSDSGIDFRWNIPAEKVLLTLDSEKTYRIFENLLVNIIKYALPGSRAYIEIEEQEENVTVSMKNISAAEICLSGSEITERFVRGDASRNTEGSGLGLAIAKSFTEIQGGTMELSIEADLFKVVLIWKKQGGQNEKAVLELEETEKVTLNKTQEG